MKINKQVRVFGKVQGVFFRKSTQQKAMTFGIHGWVKNDVDGTVLVEIEGDIRAVQEMENWLKKGPPMAVVESLDVSQSEEKGYQDFLILH
ncbi:acylphosphatase [Aquiflexum lacus]|uniref:acylphosphatase n=1 Tax=Aquiflexum lacus TaxID=2483805 RepID=UPI001E29D1FB|nr:acylphosphatase [Aquiflexum lacus]